MHEVEGRGQKPLYIEIAEPLQTRSAVIRPTPAAELERELQLPC